MKPIFTEHGRHLVGAIVFACGSILAWSSFAVTINKNHGWSAYAFVCGSAFLVATIAEVRALFKPSKA